MSVNILTIGLIIGGCQLFLHDNHDYRYKNKYYFCSLKNKK